MSLVYLAVVAALAAIQTPAEKPTKKVIEVRIVVAPLDSLKAQCAAGKFAAIDVLVDAAQGKDEPYHCPPKKKQLIIHKEAHKPDDETLVRVSYERQESVRWISDTAFIVSSITPRDPKPKEGTPQTPFGKLDLTIKPTKSIESGPITNKAAVGYQYKVVFTIGTRRIDPDVWCDP
jgi:hypothetical protein